MNGGFGLSNAAAGINDELQELLTRKFLEMARLRELAQGDRSLDLQGGRDAVAAELGRGRLKNDADTVQLGRDRHTEDARQFDALAPDREADRGYKGALTGEMIRKPTAEKEGREHDVNMANLGGTIQGRLIAQRAAADTAGGGRRQLQQVIDASGNPQIVSVDVTTGQSLPVQLPPGTQPNRPSKPVTGAERQVVAFYSRAKEADETARRFEEPIAKAGIASQLQQQFAPNMLQTSEQQAYRQAQRAFTEARLRKESGAAIPQGEYDTDARTYFAQPGDSPQVREQKRQARQTVLDGLKFSSGRAYDEFYGESAAPQPSSGGRGANPSGSTSGPKVGDVKTFPNGAKAKWDGQGWVKL